MIDFKDWTVDLILGTATHATGFTLVVDGDLCNPTGIKPGKFPECLSALEQARLVRCGVEVLITQARVSGIPKRADRVNKNEFKGLAGRTERHRASGHLLGMH